MGNLSKTLSFLMVFMLLFGSIRMPLANYPADSVNYSEACTVSALSVANTGFFCLPNKSHNIFTHTNSSINFLIEDHINGHAPAARLLEQELSLVASKYISFIYTLCPGLTVRDIIFPFHFFW
jgi:hypothetical protein